MSKVVIDRVNDLLDTKNLIDWSTNLNEFFLSYKSHELVQPSFRNIQKKKTIEYKT